MISGLLAEVEVTDEQNAVLTTNYSYDRVGRLKNENVSDGTYKSYNYNLADARTSFSVTYNGSTVLKQNYEYDELNRLQKVYKGDKTAANLIATYEYDNNSNLTKVVNGNGTQRVYEYEDTSNPNLVTKVLNKGQGDTVQNSYSYEYYLDGNVASFTEEKAGEGNRTVNYAYTKQGQLKSETDSQYADKSYTYDNYGNRSSMTEEGITTTYSYSPNNQLLTESRTEAGKTAITEYAYDPNGNMISKMGGEYTNSGQGEDFELEVMGTNTNNEQSNYVSEVYTYDSFNQLTKAVENDTVSTYTYNADGLRQSKTVNGVTTKQIWDGSNIVAEADESNQVTAKYYRGSVLISQEVNNSEAYYQYNMHGDVIGLTGADGEQTEDYDYDAFGNQINQGGESSTPFRYAGEYYDEESRLTYLRNRYYDPSAGRFITEDPAQDGTNWYVYCAGDPVNFVDPTGMWMEGDEKLSQGAQTYTKHYGEKWEEANKKYQQYIMAGDMVNAELAQKEMDDLHALANDIRDLDSQGLVTGITLPVPVYNQYNTSPHDYSNALCWASSVAMVVSLQLGDTIDRTLSIATKVAGSTILNDYNVPREWQSTDTLQLGITSGQTQSGTVLSMEEIQTTINAGNPFGVLYGANYVDNSGNSQWSGHWVVGIGYASAPGHESLVVSNDPAGGVQRIQTYGEFQTYIDGWRNWVETAQF